MKILKVIHGYPIRYNAGSEVYSQTLCQGLAARDHQVQVFTREENTFQPDYSMRVEVDVDEPRIKLNIINLPLEKHRYCYRVTAVDAQFAKLLRNFQPDIVHIGHLNHLSMSLLAKIPDHIPIIYTLHDYWLMCPRGQFIQRLSKDLHDIWGICQKQENTECALRCYSGYFSGANEDAQSDQAYWAAWVACRMRYIRSAIKRVDYFIAPSRYLLARFNTEFSLPKAKLIYLDYGFDLSKFTKCKLCSDNHCFTFGYIGTHIPAKGIQLLLKAFGNVTGKCQLKIWGRCRGQVSRSLKEIAANLPAATQANIEWLAEYHNAEIMQQVFSQIDAIVVPSIWVENSPLVIHEALQARVPVVTADVGGMAEYVQHQVNGLLFKHRDVDSLTAQMQRLVNDPKLARQLGNCGYLQSATGNIPSITEHVLAIEQIYIKAIHNKGKTLCK